MCVFLRLTGFVPKMEIPATQTTLVYTKAVIVSPLLVCAGFFEGENAHPVLSVGDVNLTSSNFGEILREAKNLLVVATSRSCHRCVSLEMEYHFASTELQEAAVRSCRILAAVK